MHFERHYAFQNALNHIFSRKPEKNLGFTSTFPVGLGYPKHRYFFYLAIAFDVIFFGIVRMW